LLALSAHNACHWRGAARTRRLAADPAAATQEITQLFKIFQILETPNDDTWPGVSKLPDYLPTFPKWHARDLAEVTKGKLDDDGLDLLRRMLRYAPHERIAACDALRHPYFADLRDSRPGTWLPMRFDPSMA
jgi:serine/threonine protein kinase